MSSGENVSKVFECDIQGKLFGWAFRCTSFTYSKDSCHKTELHCAVWGLGHWTVWRCLPGPWNNYKLKCTVCVCVHMVVGFYTAHRHAIDREFSSFVLFLFSLFVRFQQGSGEADKCMYESKKGDIYNLVYITCAHVWGGRPVPKMQQFLNSMSVLTSHAVAVRLGITKAIEFNENPHLPAQCHKEMTETTVTWCCCTRSRRWPSLGPLWPSSQKLVLACSHPL